MNSKKNAKKFCRKVLQFFGIPNFLDLQIKVSVSLLLAIQSCCAMLVSPDTYYNKWYLPAAAAVDEYTSWLPFPSSHKEQKEAKRKRERERPLDFS